MVVYKLVNSNEPELTESAKKDLAEGREIFTTKKETADYFKGKGYSVSQNPRTKTYSIIKNNSTKENYNPSDDDFFQKNATPKQKKYYDLLEDSNYHQANAGMVAEFAHHVRDLHKDPASFTPSVSYAKMTTWDGKPIKYNSMPKANCYRVKQNAKELSIVKKADGKYHYVGAIQEQELQDKGVKGFDSYDEAVREMKRYGYGKFNAKQNADIVIPKAEMVEEHEELTDLLGRTAEDLETERDKQAKELEEYKANATTLKETIEKWKQGDKKGAYESFKRDEGARPLSFEEFSQKMPDLIRRHDENIAAEKAHGEHMGKVNVYRAKK